MMALNFMSRVGLFILLLAVATLVSSCTSLLPAPSLSLSQGEQGVAAQQQVGAAERIFESDFEAVWNAVMAVLADRGESINTADKSKGLLFTNPTAVTAERLNEIAQDASPNAPYGGQYSLSVGVEELADQQTKVGIEAFIVELNPSTQNMVGGRILTSNGTLETEILDAVANKLQGGTDPGPGNPSPTLPAPVARFDVNRNNIIEDEEFFTAVDQWISGVIDDDVFFDVLDAWIRGTGK